MIHFIFFSGIKYLLLTPNKGHNKGLGPFIDSGTSGMKGFRVVRFFFAKSVRKVLFERLTVTDPLYNNPKNTIGFRKEQIHVNRLTKL